MIAEEITLFFQFTSSLSFCFYQRYAVPLRQLARDRDTAIIPLYEAQRLFGNVGEVLGANQAFLKELESLLKQGVGECKRRIGDVVYKHVSICSKDRFGSEKDQRYLSFPITDSLTCFPNFLFSILKDGMFRMLQ